jgi:hypothetical protein
VAVEMNLDSLLDKKFESKTLAEILKAPVSALAGVSEGDAQHLKAASVIPLAPDWSSRATRLDQRLKPGRGAGVRRPVDAGCGRREHQGGTGVPTPPRRRAPAAAALSKSVGASPR